MIAFIGAPHRMREAARRAAMTRAERLTEDVRDIPHRVRAAKDFAAAAIITTVARGALVALNAVDRVAGKVTQALRKAPSLNLP